ncbi:MAG: phosphate ABC transporter substrate-binding protein [Bacillota bacterium]
MRKAVMFLVAFTLFAGGCSKEDQVFTPRTEVTVLGSTALLPLIRAAAKDFMAVNPEVSVIVSGGGSITGLYQVAAGAADIGASNVKPPARDPLYQGLVDHVIGVVPFLLITHPDVGVNGLTQEQAFDIFTGKVKNWRTVGGNEVEVTIVNRLKSSGARELIKDIILEGGEFTGNAMVVNSDGEVRDAVANTPGAIGYISAGYLGDSVKALEYNGVRCSERNVVNGTYPLVAAAHMYTKGRPSGAVKAFIDFITSDSFQIRVKRMGLLPVSAVGRVGLEKSVATP